MNTPYLSALALLAVASPLFGLQINRILPHESDPSLYWWETAELSEAGDYTLLSRTLSSDRAAAGEKVYHLDTWITYTLRPYVITNPRHNPGLPPTPSYDRQYDFGAAHAYGFYLVPQGVVVPESYKVYGTAMVIDHETFQVIQTPDHQYDHVAPPDSYTPPFAYTDRDRSFTAHSSSPFWSPATIGWTARLPGDPCHYVMGMGYQFDPQGGAEGYWTYSMGTVNGWVWTRQDYHPWFYHYETGSWFYHWVNTPWCWSQKNGQWQVGMK